MVDCLIEDNDSLLDGGGIHFAGAPGSPKTLHIKRCEFLRNHTGIAAVQGFGGAIYGEYMDGVFVNTTFSTNSTEVFGGAVLLFSTNGVNAVEMDNCQFWKNTANDASQSLGGAIYLLDNGPSTGASAVLRNCTLASNTTAYCAAGQALYCGTNSNCSAWNSIFYFNHLSTCSSINPTFGLTSSDYCDIENLGSIPPGSSNFDLDPKFKSLTTGRLGLQPSSPCIDRGNAYLRPDDLLDLDGDGVTSGQPIPFDLAEELRAVDDMNVNNSGVGPGGITFMDIGAYEFQ